MAFGIHSEGRVNKNPSLLGTEAFAEQLVSLLWAQGHAFPLFHWVIKLGLCPQMIMPYFLLCHCVMISSSHLGVSSIRVECLCGEKTLQELHKFLCFIVR